MASLVTLGLSSIEVAPILGDGSIGTAWTGLCLTYEDSCSMSEEDPTTQEFYCEESDDPVVSSTKRGKLTLNFSVMDADPDALVNLLGGTTSGTSPVVWESPDLIPVIERSIKITPKQGLTFKIPRASISAKLNSQFSKKGLFLIDVVATVLKPTLTGLPRITAEA